MPPLTSGSISSPLALLANNISVSAGELPPGASPRKKPRKQQHVISTEEGDMMETNSTDEEKCHSAKPLTSRPEKRKSPPKEYIGIECYFSYVLVTKCSNNYFSMGMVCCRGNAEKQIVELSIPRLKKMH